MGKLLLEVTSPKGLRRESEMKLFTKNNQIYLIMQNTSNDTKDRCKLIFCSILIPAYDFRFNLNSN